MNYSKLITNKNILITGGAGFVGSHLARQLKSYGNRVYVLDNYFTGKKQNHQKGVIYKKGQNADIFRYFKNIPLQYIYHLGEYSRVEQSFNDLDLVLKFNTHPFYEVLRLATHHNAKLIYSGSSTKFSKNLNLVESPYSFSKRINTEILINYAKWFSLDYAITYFYNVYGPNEISDGKYATVIAKFLKLKKQKSEYLPITRPGIQKRRFTHIDDIINGLVIVGKKGKGDGFGIGATQSYNIIEIAKILKMPYKMQPKKKGNRLDAALKVTKTKKLGWKPTKKLKDYLISQSRNIENEN